MKFYDDALAKLENFKFALQDKSSEILERRNISNAYSAAKNEYPDYLIYDNLYIDVKPREDDESMVDLQIGMQYGRRNNVRTSVPLYEIGVLKEDVTEEFLAALNKSVRRAAVDNKEVLMAFSKTVRELKREQYAYDMLADDIKEDNGLKAEYIVGKERSIEKEEQIREMLFEELRSDIFYPTNKIMLMDGVAVDSPPGISKEEYIVADKAFRTELLGKTPLVKSMDFTREELPAKEEPPRSMVGEPVKLQGGKFIPDVYREKMQGELQNYQEFARHENKEVRHQVMRDLRDRLKEIIEDMVSRGITKAIIEATHKMVEEAQMAKMQTQMQAQMQEQQQSAPAPAKEQGQSFKPKYNSKKFGNRQPHSNARNNNYGKNGYGHDNDDVER